MFRDVENAFIYLIIRQIYYYHCHILLKRGLNQIWIVYTNLNSCKLEQGYFDRESNSLCRQSKNDQLQSKSSPDIALIFFDHTFWYEVSNK